MEICKAPTLRLKALNKHSTTHISTSRWKCYQQQQTKLAVNFAKTADHTNLSKIIFHRMHRAKF